MNDIYEIMTSSFCEALEEISVELISTETILQEKKDVEGNPTGEFGKYTKMVVEIPKKNGVLSRKRISIKILEDTPKVMSEELEEKDFLIRFNELEISFIDARRNVYFRAKDYTVEEI